MKYTGLLAVSFAIALGCCGCDENAKSSDGQNNAACAGDNCHSVMACANVPTVPIAPMVTRKSAARLPNVPMRSRRMLSRVIVSMAAG